MEIKYKQNLNIFINTFLNNIKNMAEYNIIKIKTKIRSNCEKYSSTRPPYNYRQIINNNLSKGKRKLS